MTPENEAAIDMATEAVCRMRRLDPDARVSETIRMTHRQYVRREVVAQVQVLFALDQAGMGEFP